MATINASDETKGKFKKIKLELSAQKGETISEEDFLNILLDKFEEKKDNENTN